GSADAIRRKHTGQANRLHAAVNLKERLRQRLKRRSRRCSQITLCEHLHYYLAISSCQAKKSEIRNSKSETNPKFKISNTNLRCLRLPNLGFRILSLFRVSDFEFRFSLLRFRLRSAKMGYHTSKEPRTSGSGEPALSAPAKPMVDEHESNHC